MTKLNIATGLVCLLLGACGGTKGVAAPPAAPEAATVSSAQRSVARIGFTRGSMQDPEGLAWQSDLLHAIGRDGQYSLFDYVFVGAEADGNVYVGVNVDSLGLTSAQLDAANQVQGRYRQTKMAATTVDGILVANAWPQASGAVASNGAL
jgi:hypothetical protein